MNKSQDILLQLLRVSLGNSLSVELPDKVDWMEVLDIASEHSVHAVAFDAFDKLPEECRPDIDSLMEWLGQTEYVATIYEEHKQTLVHFGEFYAKHGFPVMLLKGYGLSLNYPKPNHRPAGDIDCYMFGHWQETDALMHSELGTEIDLSHHHHTVFQFEGQSVENHYDFINVHSHRGNNAIEKRFKELATTKGQEILPNIYEPVPLLNALFVIRHAGLHFASGEMTIRQILDWALLIKGQQTMDWNQFWKDAKDMGMESFVLAMNGIAIKYLGFKEEIFHVPASLTIDWALVDRILDDIFNPDFGGERPKGYIPYTLWIIRRFFAHSWKHKIVYSDSLVSTFCWQAISHLMKPSTLRGRG